jgi:hypothetical protein
MLSVPLSSLQIEVLEVLASARDPESYVAGSAPLNLSSARYSADIDIFHDRAERIAAQAEADAALLEAAGFTVAWQRQLAFIHSATITKGGEQTKLEWVGDSDFRFFPVVRDPLFGYRLHPVDLAINKLFAAAGRSEPRDIFDLMIIHESVAPLSILVWAGVEKSPGFTPEGLIAEVRRNLLHPLSAWQEVAVSDPFDPKLITEKVRAALDSAEAFAARMPTDKLGLLFLDSSGAVVEPDPAHLSAYDTHAGQRRGHWPTSAEITQAMFERMYSGSSNGC